MSGKNNETYLNNFELKMNLTPIQTSQAMLSVGLRQPPLYYAEQKAKIGTIELSLKPDLDNKFDVDISPKCLRVSTYELFLVHTEVASALIIISVFLVHRPRRTVTP